MTPEEEYRLLRETSAEINDAVSKAFDELIKKIRAGTAPRDAVQAVMDSFSGEYAKILAAGLSVAISESVGSAADLVVGEIKLSSRLYAQSEATSAIVQGVVQNHTRGYNDARALALELYEGYGFNPTEPLNLKPGNSALPKYLREVILPDKPSMIELSKIFAKAQTKALKTGALKAAYTELLEAVDDAELGVGQKHLEKKIQVAFEEKMRYYAKRIAETEIHRAFSENHARDLMADSDVEYVEWRLSPWHPVHDICDYFAGVDRYGLGNGVYPKAFAPVAPAHPHCKCVLTERFDLNGKSIKDVQDAELAYFNTLPPDKARKVAGSEKKLERVKAGETAWEVHNSNTDPIYQVKTVGQVN